MIDKTKMSGEDKAIVIVVAMLVAFLVFAVLQVRGCEEHRHDADVEIERAKSQRPAFGPNPLPGGAEVK